jgi:imidazolonepropionase
LSRKLTRSKTKEKADLLIVNADELVTVAGGNDKPRTGKQMKDIGVIHDGAVAIKDGRIAAVGKTAEVKSTFKAETVISANGKTVTPGFVDPHTHLIFSGSREDELQMRIEGAYYLEILSAGGGILKTVRETRKASVEKLAESGSKTLDTMIEHGSTTVEAKSGYGLDTKNEIKILEAIKRLNQMHAVDLVPTFLGAHAIPPEYKTDTRGYVDLVTSEMIPKVGEKDLAKFCDVFCEKGAFSLEQSRKILITGRENGLKSKIHADEMSTLGGAELAADIRATSADHLLFSSDDGLKAMAAKEIIAVLLPATAFALMTGRYADARKMIDIGLPIALGTDFSPSCMVESQQLTITFACHMMRLAPAEALIATTINAAHAIGRASEVGSLEVGKKADLIVLDAPNHRFLGYHFGSNLVDKVIKNGRVIVDWEERRGKPVFVKESDTS